MSSAQALIRRDDSAFTVAFTETALALKTEALEAGALVGKVNDADSQDKAVQAQRKIAEVLSLAEKARKAAKEPVLEFGRRIDTAAAAFVGELKEEQLRLAQLVADFQQLEQARIRAAQQAEQARLAAIERERAAELLKAQTHEQLDKIQETFNRKAEEGAPPPETITPIRAAGQRIKEEWSVTVTDIWALARAHPACVTITPRMGDIKDLLNAGVKVAGVRAEKEIRAGVTGRGRAAIDI